MKNALKRILAFIVVNVILGIGIWGVITSESDTEVGWQLLGWMLAVITISFPTINFWWDKMNWLLDLED
jgi:hypothetical protein